MNLKTIKCYSWNPNTSEKNAEQNKPEEICYVLREQRRMLKLIVTVPACFFAIFLNANHVHSNSNWSFICLFYHFVSFSISFIQNYLIFIMIVFTVKSFLFQKSNKKSYNGSSHDQLMSTMHLNSIFFNHFHCFCSEMFIIQFCFGNFISHKKNIEYFPLLFNFFSPIRGWNWIKYSIWIRIRWKKINDDDANIERKKKWFQFDLFHFI